MRTLSGGKELTCKMTSMFDCDWVAPCGVCCESHEHWVKLRCPRALWANYAKPDGMTFKVICLEPGEDKYAAQVALALMED